MTRISDSQPSIHCNHRVDFRLLHSGSRLHGVRMECSAGNLCDGVEKTTSFGGVTIADFFSMLTSRLLKQLFELVLPVPSFQPKEISFVITK